MTLQNFIFYAAGILVELLLLGQNFFSGKSSVNPRFPQQLRMVNPAHILIAAVAAIGGICLLVVHLMGIGETKVYIDTPFVSLLFIVLGVFVFFAAIAGNLFLPVINEQAILVVQGLVLYYVFSGGREVAWMPLVVLVSVPALICLGLILWRWRLPAELKAILYLWYLLSLMVIPFQSNQVAYFRRVDITLAESAAFGALLVFLIIHGLFAVRFFLITSSMLLPRNRIHIRRVMPFIFSDEQVPIVRLVFTILLLTGAIFLNRRLNLLPEDAILSLGTMFAVQFLSQHKLSQNGYNSQN